MISKFGMYHGGLKPYKVYINDDPVLTLAYFTCFCTYSRARNQVSVYRTIDPLVNSSFETLQTLHLAASMVDHLCSQN